MDAARAAQEAKGYWRQFRTGFYFDNPKDQIAGVVLGLEEEGPAKDPLPRLIIQTKDGYLRVVVASQERLKSLLVDACPAVGDRIQITYTGDQPKSAPGMTPAKLFTVEVRRQGTDPGSGTGPTRPEATRSPAKGSDNGPRVGSTS